MKRVVIVGGGITGLAAAHALDAAKTRFDVRLFEARPQLGGNLVTVTHNGFVIDGGPDSWVSYKPHATRLAKDVGLGDELIGTRPDTRKVYIVWQKRLHAMPEGLVLGIPTEIRPFLATELLGWDAKLRAGLDLVVPRRTYRGDEDESIASFIRRRLGGDIEARIAGPLLGGIFAGDPESLSVRACVPQLVEAESTHGSLIRAMLDREKLRAEARESGGDGPAETEGSTFISLKRGVGDLVLNVAHRLRDVEVRRSCPVTRVTERAPGDPRGRFSVETPAGAFDADHLCLTLPAHAAARVVAGFDEELAARLAEIAYVSSATAFLAYRKFDVRHPLDASGFLVPRAEGRPILAASFVSSKWEHRAPAGQALVRVFFGGAGNEGILAQDDDDLAAIAREQLLDLLGIDRPPMFTRVFRFDKASPQPQIGHLGRMRRIFERVATHEGLAVGGNGYVGSGIPDAIKQGEEIAARIVAS